MDINHKLVQQGRKSILFGMRWYAIEEDENPRKAAGQMARTAKTPVDIMLARKSETTQYAVGSTAMGGKSGSVSAAAMIAENVGVESWLYVLDLGGPIWVCSGRDGFVLPNGDEVFDDAVAATKAFNDFQPATFKKVAIPASWKKTAQSDIDSIASDVEITSLSEFLSMTPPKWAKTTSISSKGTLLKGGVALALMAAIGGGAMMFMNQQPEPQDPDLLRQQQLLLQQQLAAQSRNDKEERFAALDANRPWERSANASETLTQCLAGLGAMPARPIGYEVTTMICTQSAVQAAVERTTGYGTWLMEWADLHQGLTVSVNPTGETGSLSMSMPAATPRGTEQLSDFEGISAEMLRYGQIDGSAVDLTTPAAPVIPDEPEYRPIYAKSEYEITTTRPNTWTGFFRAFPGVTVSSVAFNPSNQTYTIEGSVYVSNL